MTCRILRASLRAFVLVLLLLTVPLGWEYINLTGDYIWQQNKLLEQGEFRPLRTLDEA